MFEAYVAGGTVVCGLVFLALLRSMGNVDQIPYEDFLD